MMKSGKRRQPAVQVLHGRLLFLQDSCPEDLYGEIILGRNALRESRCQAVEEGGEGVRRMALPVEADEVGQLL